MYIKKSIFETMKRIFRYSFQGPMVGHKENNFMTWEELPTQEQEAYKDKESYKGIVKMFKN
jgi:hypothetical protein